MKKYIVILLAVALIGCGKDGGLGPQGPAGPTGSTGSQGQAGLNGTNALNNVKTYVVVAPMATNDPIVVTVDAYDTEKPPLFIAYTSRSNPKIWTAASVVSITANSVAVSHSPILASTALVYQITSLE